MLARLADQVVHAVTVAGLSCRHHARLSLVANALADKAAGLLVMDAQASLPVYRIVVFAGCSP